MKNILRGVAALLLSAAFISTTVADEAEKYLLRYKFQPNETIRWHVEHRNKVRATVSGTTQTTETLSVSVKAWQVADVKSDGTATFEHRVESVDMRQKLTGRDEVRYNSLTDAKPPAGYEDVAKSVGVPLAVVTISPKGKVLHRDRRKKKTPAQTEGWMTIPLPEEPVAVGHTWSLPQNIDVPLEGGTVKKVKTLQRFTLEGVKTGVATIQVSTDILTPITDPAIESKLVQSEGAGRVRFDIDAGRVISQQIDIDKHVVGFRGDASSIHYVNRFSERLVPETPKTADKATGGRQ